MQIKIKSSPDINPWGPPERVGFHSEAWPFKATLYSQISRWFSNRESNAPSKP